jgi:hypothetical protein
MSTVLGMRRTGTVIPERQAEMVGTHRTENGDVES